MSLKSMATMSESLSEKHVHLQLMLIDVKCDGELVRIVAYDVGLFAIDGCPWRRKVESWR